MFAALMASLQSLYWTQKRCLRFLLLWVGLSVVFDLQEGCSYYLKAKSDPFAFDLWLLSLSPPRYYRCSYCWYSGVSRAAPEPVFR